MAFDLDARIVAATLPVGDLMLSRVLLKDDARFPWAILVPRRPDIIELIDLPAAERTILMEEAAATATALRDLYKPTKLNVAMLGNTVTQLHLHVIARFETDAAWPDTTFSAGAAQPYAPEAATAAVASLAARLGCA